MQKGENVMHSHIGVPKFIQKGFSKNNSVAKLDIANKKIYFESIDRLGTENNYYTDTIEKQVLAMGVEANFSSFITKLKNEEKIYLTQKIIKENINSILEFVKFAYARSKRVFNKVKNENVTTELFKDFSHSTFLGITSQIDCNPLQMLDDGITIFVVINETEKNFINNSVGFGYNVNKKNKFSFFWIPIETKKGIIIKTYEEKDLETTHYIADRLNYVEQLNMIMFLTEKCLGNGFIFGQEKKDVELFENRIEI